MKAINIIYWISTGLLVLLMGSHVYGNITSDAQWVGFFKHFGYPVYVLPFLGVAKLLGVIALLVPGFARLKEWAYAGFVFDITLALYSCIAVGDPVSGWIWFLLFYAIVFVSYIYHHKRLAAKKAAAAQVQ
jgi:uncharacterized membrane protein YphA (DoxX/SURF4 family)